MEPCMLLEMGDERKLAEMVKSGVWHYERKYDGARALITTESERIKANGGDGRYDIIGRAWRSLSSQFPELEAVAAQLPPESLIDGEIFVPLYSEDKSKPTTGNRTNAGDGARRAKLAPAVFCVFDAPRWKGLALTQEPIEARKHVLIDGLSGCPNLQIVMPLEDPLAEWSRIIKDGDEGFVAKRKGSPYIFGRSDLWLKVKNHNYFDNKPVIGFTSEKRALSAFILEGGHKVNCSLSFKERAPYEKFVVENRGSPMLASDGSKGWTLPKGITVDIRVLATNKGTLRFPTLISAKLEGENGD